MTLNITVLTDELIYQSADFRTIGPPDSEISPKITTLSFPSFVGFVTYAGIGGYNRTDVSSLVANWLAGSPDRSLADVASLLQANGNKLVADVERAKGEIWEMTFVLAGFTQGNSIVYVISNCENIKRERYLAERHLKISSRGIRKSRKATVIVTGSGAKWITVSDRKALGNVAARYPHDSGRIRRRLEVLHREAFQAETRRKKKTGKEKDRITPHCMVVSFRSDGSGALRLDPDAEKFPVFFPSVSFGMNMTDMLAEAFRNAGIDPKKIRIVQAGFASSYGQGKKADLPPCQFTIANPEPSSGYQLRELTGDGNSLNRASAINDSGMVVGTAAPLDSRTYHAPWVWHAEKSHIFNFPGAANAINNSGEIAVSKQTPDGKSHACVIANGDLIDLYERLTPTKVFTVTNSWAYSINNSGILCGCVEDRSREDGETNPISLPAYWRPRPVIVAVGQPLPNGHGGQAVDVNQHGMVLIMEAIAPFDTRCILWNTSNGTNAYVGASDANVFPIGLTDSGIVLGQYNNERGQKVAVTCPAGGNWQRLGTDDGWAPVSINLSGDVVGRVQIEGIDRPWLRRSSGELIMLPYLVSHGTIPTSTNNSGQIVGLSNSDHGSHAVLWEI